MISYRRAVEADAVALGGIARQCPPLDVHTPYTYWVLATFFSETCMVAEADGEPVGMLLSVPFRNSLFLWQYGVLPERRRQGIATRMLSITAMEAKLAGREQVVATVTPGNSASLEALGSVASRLGFWFEQEGTMEVPDPVTGAPHPEAVWALLLSSR